MKKYSFNVFAPTLKISANSNIAVSPSKDGLIKVEVDGTDKAIENITVKQQGDNIVIEDRSSSGNSQTIVSNGRTVISGDVVMGNSISMVNGDIHINGGSGSVYFNGKRIDLDGDRSDSKEAYTSKATLITIYTPIADLDLTLKGLAKFASSQNFDDACIDLSGCTQAVFTANSVELDLSGTSEAKVQINGGELTVDTSGTSQALIVGDFKSCKSDSSGTSKISTSGTCFGDYKASASGCSSIRHKGEIKGRTKEKVSGIVASINI